MVDIRSAMASISAELLERLEKVREAFDVSERQMCKAAGIKSPSQIAAARSRGSALRWDHVAALAALLSRHGVSREWLLWGEGRMVTGKLLRLGDSSAIQARPIAGKRGGERQRAPNVAPGPAVNRRRPKDSVAP